MASDCSVKTKDEIIKNLPALDQFNQDTLAKLDITGISLVVFQGNEVLFEKAYGDGIGQPFFQAASISKPLAAFAALKLVERGLLKMDAALSRFVAIPYLPPQPFADLVTLRTVLNHTSGMNNDVTGEDRNIYFKPGTQTSYSGGAFMYMQQAMEDVSHKPFETLMAEELKRLAMTSSTFELTYEGERYVNAAFSLLTTPKELSLFFRELGSPQPHNSGAASQMTTPSFPLDEVSDRGLGVILERCGDVTGVYHTGSNFSIHKSIGIIYPKTQVGAVVMVRGKDAYQFPGIIANLAIGGL